jgi:hypothetical protein
MTRPVQGGQTAKTRELHTLGIDPTLGIALNVAYSGVTASLCLWVLSRALISRPSDAASEPQSPIRKWV